MRGEAWVIFENQTAEIIITKERLKFEQRFQKPYINQGQSGSGQVHSA